MKAQAGQFRSYNSISIIEISTEQTRFLNVPTTQADIEERYRIRNQIPD
jgi:hypothetical protein